jgi:hypothetical protein
MSIVAVTMAEAIERVESARAALKLLTNKYPELISEEPIFQKAVKLNFQIDDYSPTIDIDLTDPLPK